MFQFIFYLIVIYFAYKAFKYFVGIFSGPVASSKNEEVHETKHPSEKIKSEDVIDADFEEIDTKKSEE
ncbi:hypothetical protein BMS3Abin04_02438 [bacterium BMS3Abin04]|nr:hypothetical protein BMS3Abin04_02438 [bacterium BMS3Abin04]